MDVIISKNVLLGSRWKLAAAILRQKQSPGLRQGAQLEPQLKHQPLRIFFCLLFYPHHHTLPSPRRHHFFQRVFGHPSSPSSSRHLLRPGGEGVVGVEHERVPLSLADPAGAGPQVPAQGVPGRALLHDPLQHLSDPAGHIHTGLRRAPVPQQLYVGSKEAYNFNFIPRCVVHPSSKCWCRLRDS